MIARSAWDRHEPSAKWGAQLAVFASAEVPTLAHKVCNQLVNLFILGVAQEFPLLMKQQEDLFLATQSLDTKPNQILEKSENFLLAP